MFIRLRWSDKNGEPYCPHCGCLTVYDCRRPNGRSALALQGVPQGFQRYQRDTVRLPQDAAADLPRWQSRSSPTRSRARPCWRSRRDLGTSVQDGFRPGAQDARSDGVRGSQGRDRRRRQDGRDRWRLFRRIRQARQPARIAGIAACARTRSGKRKVVVVIRERGGKTLPACSESEADSLTFIRRQVAARDRRYMPMRPVHGMSCRPATTLHRINHQEAYSLPTSDLHERRRGIFLAACAGPKSGTITMSPAPIWSATHKKRHGVRITAESRTASQVDRIVGPGDARTSRASISAATGSGAEAFSERSARFALHTAAVVPEIRTDDPEAVKAYRF